jgi:hypothetical protein
MTCNNQQVLHLLTIFEHWITYTHLQLFSDILMSVNVG